MNGGGTSRDAHGGARARRRARAGAATLAVTAALLLVNREVLWLPPYEDQAVGLWTEADYLAQTGFDYRRLRYEEAHYMSPRSGPRSYMISLLPTLIAATMRLAPRPEVTFLIWHVATQLFAAITLVLAWHLLRPALRRHEALLVTLGLAATPLFRAQVELLGMDVPMTAFALASLALLARQAYVAAAGASLAAFAIKASGNLVTLSGGLVVALQWLGPTAKNDPQARRQLRAGLSAYGLVAAIEFGLLAWGDTSIETRRAIQWPTVLRLPAAIYWCPDVVALFAYCLFAALANALGHWRRKRGGIGLGALADLAERFPAELTSWLVVLATLAASALYIFIPRYFIAGTALLWLIAGWQLGRLKRGRNVAAAVLALAVVFQFANGWGRFYPDIAWAGAADFARDPGLHERSCPFTERSLEYRAELAHDQRLLRSLEQEGAGRTIFLPLPYFFLATKPRLGYVAAPLNAANATVFEDTLAAFVTHALRAAAGDVPSAAIIVWAGRSRITVPPPQFADRVLYDDRQRTPVWCYTLSLGREGAGGDAIEESALAERYLSQTWPGEFLSARVLARYPYLARTGRTERLWNEVTHALAHDPSPMPEVAQLADLLAAGFPGEPGEGRAATAPADPLRDLSRRDPRTASSARVILAALWQADPDRVRGALAADSSSPLASPLARLCSGDLGGAQTDLENQAKSASGPDLGLVELALGTMASAVGELAEAETWLDRAARNLGSNASVLNQQGLLASKRGDWSGAQALFNAALAQRPDLADAHNNLGLALARMGSWVAAARSFESALQHSPGWDEARRNLENVRARLETGKAP